MYGNDTERWRGWKPGEPSPFEIDAAKKELKAKRLLMLVENMQRRPGRHVNLPTFDEKTLEEVA
jgi:hypothetical protein